MGKNKLKHFAEMLSFDNVLQFDKQQRGKWHERFGNQNPITLELACGKGEYTVGLAERFPARNVIGIDIKGARIYTGAKRATELGLSNALFLRMQIDHLPDYFAPHEVGEIWITFPDPHLRVSKAKHRLTSPKYISIYKQVFRPEGIVNLKTDSDSLYDYTLETVDELKLTLLEHTNNVYAHAHDPALDIQTYYERMHLANGKTIKYVRFAIGQRINDA